MSVTSNLALVITAEDMASSVISKITGQLSATKDELAKMTESLKVEQAWKTTARTLETIGSVTYDTSKNALNMAMDFDDSMRQVASVVGLPMEAMGELSAKALEMGNTTKFHASEAADAMYYMGLAGWDDQQIIEGLNGVMMLSAASGVDLASTSDIVTDALTAFGLSAADSNHFVDVLAQTSRSSNTNVDLLGQSFKYVAPLAGALGLTIEDTGVAMGLMANAGVKADTAGVALRNMLTNMINPTKKQAEAMDALGVSIVDDEGNMKSLMDVMKDLRNVSDDMTKAELEAEITALAGKEALSGVTAIITASEEDFNALVESINNADGAAQEMADVMEGGAGGSLRELESRLETLQITVGNALVPAFDDLLNKLMPLIDKFTEFVANNPGIVEAITMIALGLGGAGGLIDGVIKIKKTFSELSPIIEVLKTAFTGLWAILSANPVVLVIIGIVAAIAALVAGFIYLWNHCEPFKQFWLDLWDNIKNVVSVAWEWLQTLPEKFSQMWEGIKTWASEKYTAINTWIENTVDGIVTWLTELPGKISTWFTNLWTSITEWGTRMWEGICEWWDQLPYQIGYALGFVLGNIVAWATDTWNYLTVKVPEIIDNVVTFFAELPGKIWEWLVNTYQRTTKWLANMWNIMTTVISETITAVVKFFSELPGKIWTWLLNALQKTATWLGDMYTKAKEGIKKVFGVIVNTITELPGKMLEIGKNIVTGLWDGISSMVGWIGDKISGFVSGIIDGFKAGFDQHSPSKIFAEMGRLNIAGLYEGMQTAVDRLDLPAMAATITADFDRAYQQMAPAYAMAGGNTSNYQDSHNTTVNFTGDIVMSDDLDVESVAQYIVAVVANQVY